MKHKLKIGNVLTIVTISVLMFSVLAGGYLYYQLFQLEEGVLDVCAKQQDAYVQLVLDQINLKQNRDNEEIIEDILSTLDASSNKYWTFSKEEDMVFVKDVLETNKYKGLTAASYYSSDTAREFLKGLRVDRVTHAEIRIQEKDYIASGVTFRYRDAEYRLCLLTNKAVLLDNNMFLGAKIEFITLAAVVLLVFIVVVMAMAFKLQKTQDEKLQAMNLISELGYRLERMDEQLMGKALHDRYQDLWLRDALPDFLIKLKKRDSFPLVFAHITCENMDMMREFLGHAKNMMDKNVIRFRITNKDLLFIFVRDTEENVKWNLVPALTGGVTLRKCFVIESKQELDLHYIGSNLEIGEVNSNESENIS